MTWAFLGIREPEPLLEQQNLEHENRVIGRSSCIGGMESSKFFGSSTFSVDLIYGSIKSTENCSR